MKSTSCDSVGLTSDLYACVIELKEDQPVRYPVEQLALTLAFRPTTSETTARDEQILSLP